MLRLVPLAAIVAIISASAFAAVLPLRFEKIVNSPKIEIQISEQPFFQVQMLPFPMEGPFGDSSDRTEEELQKLLREFGVGNK
jgi:hypothetical protein